MMQNSKVITTPKVIPIEALTEAQPRRQVGILGGNFNPVHQAHLVMAQQVGQKLGLEKVYLMPEFLPPHVDEKKTIDAAHRLNMLELAIEENPLLEIEMIELERQGKSYTYDTMQMLTEHHPDTDFYFIIGSDMVQYLPKWHRIDELIQLVQFVGVKRPMYDAKDNQYPVIWVDIPEFDLSSTFIRQQVSAGCSIRYLVPDKVRRYIEEKGLYLDEV